MIADINRRSRILGQVPGSIEQGRWYDVKIEVSGNHAKRFLDGELALKVDLPGPSLPGLFASASRQNNSGEIILKVVNSRAVPAETQVLLQGASGLAPTMVATLLSGNPEDLNSIEDPDQV